MEVLTVLGTFQRPSIEEFGTEIWAAVLAAGLGLERRKQFSPLTHQVPICSPLGHGGQPVIAMKDLVGFTSGALAPPRAFLSSWITPGELL